MAPKTRSMKRASEKGDLKVDKKKKRNTREKIEINSEDESMDKGADEHDEEEIYDVEISESKKDSDESEEDSDDAEEGSYYSEVGSDENIELLEIQGLCRKAFKDAKKKNVKEMQRLCRKALKDAKEKKADKSRQKQRYVWAVVSHDIVQYIGETFDVFLIMTKQTYEHYERCQKVRYCKNWGQVQDLGNAVYEEAKRFYTGRETDPDPSDDDIFDSDRELEPGVEMPRDKPLNGYFDFDNADHVATFPPLLFEEMYPYRDEHEWLFKYSILGIASGAIVTNCTSMPNTKI